MNVLGEIIIIQQIVRMMATCGYRSEMIAALVSVYVMEQISAV